jgi:FAD/FMN-containing dehydrogenase/short-subunit dehydrogenase
MRQKVTNWGLYPQIISNNFTPTTYEEVCEIIREQPCLIARGNGRCYGDASLSNTIISTLGLDKILEFDEKKGTLRCQAGVLLSTILDFVVPKGYFLPVTPGTKFITIGGAFSSDIHGKNHHIDGVFSDHCHYIKLANQEGQILTLSPTDDLFYKTAGGLGLTGVILEIEFSLKKIESSYIKQTSIRANNLTEIFNLFEKHKDKTYSVAWIDCLARNENVGRSVLILGEHAKQSEVKNTKELLKLHSHPFLNVPLFFPGWVLNSMFIRIFNFLYFNKPSSQTIDAIAHYDPFFYPLDKINNWNKIYGKKGLVQYQFVIPKEKSFEGVSAILNILSKNKLGSFLAVLKLFGKSHDNRYLEFPIEGYTLALDIKIEDSIWQILDELDEIVTNLGGKIYMTKDARISKSIFEKQYPNRLAPNPKFISHQSIRLNQHMKEVFLIIGANSDIAKKTALLYLKKNSHAHLYLTVRDKKSITDFITENNIQDRCDIFTYDVTDIHSAKAFVENLPAKPKWIMYSAGVLYTNEECMSSTEKWNNNLQVNFNGPVAILNELVQNNNPYLERIIGMSSIAALRGRKSNFVYGAAKSGFHQYLFGLRQSLKDRGIVVQAITPGVVDTKMTANLAKPTITVSPDLVAQGIMENQKQFEVYPNFIWKIIALIVKWSPEFVVSKL